MGFKNDWGSEMRRYKCGCAYKDAHKTGLYPSRFNITPNTKED